MPKAAINAMEYHFTKVSSLSEREAQLSPVRGTTHVHCAQKNKIERGVLA
jgi:hypothetical protein